MKSSVGQVVGKRIVGVIAKQARDSDKTPASSLFLLFEDGTYFELWGNVHAAGGVDPGGPEEVRGYLQNRMNIIFEKHEEQPEAEAREIRIKDSGPYLFGRVATTDEGVELRFGGLRVLHPSGRNKFELMSRSQFEPAIVDEADVPDTIRFMASRFNDFSGTIERKQGQ